MKKAAQKMPRRSRREAPPRGKRAPPPDPPPPASSLPRDALLLFPRSGYPASLFQEKLPGAIRQVKCTRVGLVVLKADREVLVFDREEDGGCPSRGGRPMIKKSKKNARASSLDCEVSHLLILSSEGKLYEHHIASGRIKSKPRLLNQLGNKQIVQIACGDYHSMALSKGGELFAWGQNEYGQLGMGRKSSPVKDPQLVRELQCIPLGKIAAGSAHSLALSLSGAVYSWGNNSSGQLGLGDTKDRYCPIHVKAIEHMKTVAISCGGEHTAVLLKGGLVSTFGAGSHGQLGHNSTRNELFPRMVAELFGAQVSQVACGRWHTLVYAPDLGKVYSFGSGAEGQLGNGKNSDRLVPLPLDLTMNGRTIILERRSSKEVVEIIAGENQSIALLLKEKSSYANVYQIVAKVEEERVEKWVSNTDAGCWKHMLQEIKLIFSSAACINGSFLDKREKYFSSSWKTAGVDPSAVFLFCEKIAVKPKVFTQVIKGLNKLLRSLPTFPASPEALRVFLVVPILLRKEDIESDCLLSQLAEAICLLPQQAKQILECLWSNLEVTFFKDLVALYQKLVCVKLSAFINLQRCSDHNISTGELIPSIQVLQMLYEVNRKAGFRIQENNFYIPDVKRILTLPSMSHIRNVEEVRRILPRINELQLALNTLILFPCMFDLEDKIAMHKLSCTFLNTMNLGAPGELHVRRQHLVQDTWQGIRSATICFQRFLRVDFEGEPGIDDGGLSQEFFSLLGRELCAPEKQIFRHFEESHLIWFSRQVSSQDDIYFLIGNLCGMAFYNMKTADFPFPLALFKKMANVPLTLEDLKELSPIEASNLQVILDEPYEDIIEEMMLDFTVIEKHEEALAVVELKENGANIPVTKYNRKEYVDAYINHMLTVSVKNQFEDFRRGFERGCPTNTWQMFLPAELRVVLLGHREYDWEQLEKNADYVGYEKSDEIIQDFWAVFHDLPEENKKKFLAFLTGTDRIPAQGMEKFTFIIADPKQPDPDLWYPVACTCLKIFFLPRYTDRDILEKRVLCALEWFEKFGLA
ncbi:E3 ISG15--protein ligase HERC5 isoform X2 [Pogona vitticeps]